MTPKPDDPLLNALIFLGKFYSRPVSAFGALQGLPLAQGKLTPDLFARAAANCGFESRLIARRIEDLHAATLPAVLILKNNEAVILTQMDRGSEGVEEVVLLSTGSGTQQMPMASLRELYSGYAILVKPEFKFESRSDFHGKTLGKHWFWSTLWGFKSFYLRVGLATVMINLLALVSSIFTMTVYDRVVPNKAVDTLMVLSIAVAVAYLFDFLLKMLRSYFVDRAGHRIDMKLGSELYARILGMQYGSRPKSAGALASQARSYESLREFFTSATLAAIVDLPFVYLFSAVVFLLGGWIVTVPLLVGFGLVLFVGAALQLPIYRAVNSSYHSANQRQALFVEGIQALETIKTTRSESELQARMEDAVRVAAKSDGQARGVAQLALNCTGLISNLVQVLVIIAAFFQVMEGNMSMGAMIACVMLCGRAMAPMAMAASLLSRLQQSRRALKGLDQIMQTPVERDRREQKYLSVDKFIPSIKATGVKFAYSTGAEPVVKDLDFEIKPGERIAILGRIGSGKSTLLRMLMALYYPTEGRIDISGIDLRQLDPVDLRMGAGYVPQNPTLLYGSIRSNLKCGCPWVSDTAMLRAIDRAGLSEFVKALPNGVEYEIGEGGSTLSGGQRQALAVARALIEEPDLLILDEPTSAMDLNSEKRLLHCLRDYLDANNQRTLIIATHKRSVLSLVDRIIVMDAGRIIADGPRDTILKRPEPQAGEPSARRGSHLPASEPGGLPR